MHKEQDKANSCTCLKSKYLTHKTCSTLLIIKEMQTEVLKWLPIQLLEIKTTIILIS